MGRLGRAQTILGPAVFPPAPASPRECALRPQLQPRATGEGTFRQRQGSQWVLAAASVLRMGSSGGTWGNPKRGVGPRPAGLNPFCAPLPPPKCLSQFRFSGTPKRGILAHMHAPGRRSSPGTLGAFQGAQGSKLRSGWAAV